MAICPHCGSQYSTVRGFVYEADEAYAPYFAGLYPGHEDRRMALDIAMGDWDDAAPEATRTRVALEIWPDSSDINMHVHERENWNWADSETFGRLLSRDEALAHPDIDQYFEVAGFIVSHDPRIEAYLDRSID